MPASIGPVGGLECKLYYQPTLAATFTIAGAVLITEAVDVNVSLATGKIDAPSRASNFKPKLPGLTELSLSFGYNYQSDSTDAVFTALRQAYLARTMLHWAVMDNLIATPGPKGSQGITFIGIIYDFPMDQPLEGAVKLDIGVELARHKVSSAIVDPAWLTITPT
jgi:hypothetical protein